VYVQVNGGQEFSAVTNQAGSWLIPLNQGRTEDLTSYLPVVERMDETILARSGGQIASAVTDSLNDSPVPDMQLGKEYDFRKQQAKLSQQSALAVNKIPATMPEKTQPSFPIGGAVLGNNDVKIPQVSISSPKDNSAIVTTKPLIQGTGIPGKFVGLSIGSLRPIHASVKIEQNGLWSYTPSRALNEGKQKITVTTVDTKGKFVSLSHTFTILKSGTQVLGDATPSATLSPTLTTTPQLTVTPFPESTESGTPEPTGSLTGESPPDTGNAVPTLFILFIGLGLLFGGSFVLSK
jgi:hypothetical protein